MLGARTSSSAMSGEARKLIGVPSKTPWRAAHPLRTGRPRPSIRPARSIAGRLLRQSRPTFVLAWAILEATHPGQTIQTRDFRPFSDMATEARSM